MQSVEKSDYASYAQALCGVALKFTFRPHRFYQGKFLTFPEEKWYNKVKETFESEYAAKFFDTDKIVKLLNDYYEGKAMTHRKVYTIYCFLIWYKQYFVEG